MSRKVLLAAALAVLAVAPAAHAAPALNGSFDVSGNPKRLTTGPDGNVWFVLDGSTKELGKIAPDGTVTEYDSPGDVALTGITTGPDLNLWATATNAIVKIPPANPAGGTTFAENGIGTASDIVTGPDGHLWTGSNTTVIEIPPDNPGQAGGDVPHAGIVAGTGLGIAVGSDGNLWVMDNNLDNSRIVRFNTAGTLIGTPTNTGGALNQGQIAAGPPGQLAFTQPFTNPQRIQRIDISGNLLGAVERPPGFDATGIVFGNDGAYWTANFAAETVGRLTPDGQFTEPFNFPALSGPRYVAKGANDTLWVGLEQAKKIARITGVSAPPPPAATPPPATPPKAVTFKGLKPRGSTFRVKGKFVTIPLACPSFVPDRCSGTMTLRTQKAVAAKKKRRLKLGSAKFSIKPATTKRVRVKLSKKALKLLRRKHTLKAVATTRATAGGASKTTSKRVTLKRKR